MEIKSHFKTMKGFRQQDFINHAAIFKKKQIEFNASNLNEFPNNLKLKLKEILSKFNFTFKCYILKPKFLKKKSKSKGSYFPRLRLRKI